MALEGEGEEVDPQHRKEINFPGNSLDKPPCTHAI